MSTTSPTLAATPIVVMLRNPAMAAFLGWLIPGAGHLYQRRTAKGILFFVTILATFFYGLYLGEGKVVYASWRQNDTRWFYIPQLGVGLMAMPALVQAYRAPNDPTISFMAPPNLNRGGEGGDLAQWNKDLGRYFELGTIYTVIAGLLNILAVFDALAGPVESGDVIEKEETPATA